MIKAASAFCRYKVDAQSAFRWPNEKVTAESAGTTKTDRKSKT